MSRTNVFTLIATLLLGILLFTILRFEGSLPEAPPADSIRETAPPADAEAPEFRTPAGGLPRVSTHVELQTFLDARGLDGINAIGTAARWRQSRGFIGTNTLLGVTEKNAPATTLQSLSDERLRTMLAAGNAGASQTLAARALFTDPFAALDLYRMAAELGSVYAVLRIGALLESLTDLSLDNFVAEPTYLRKLSELRSMNTDRNPNFPALSHVLAAARDGGLPIIDTETLQWMQRLSTGFSESEMHAACERSSQLFLELGAERRQNGLQPIWTKPPPVFLSVPELENRLPCRATSYPIIQLLDLSQCSRTSIQDSRGEPVDLHICRN